MASTRHVLRSINPNKIATPKKPEPKKNPETKSYIGVTIENARSRSGLDCLKQLLEGEAHDINWALKNETVYNSKQDAINHVKEKGKAYWILEMAGNLNSISKQLEKTSDKNIGLLNQFINKIEDSEGKELSLQKGLNLESETKASIQKSIGIRSSL